jgi:hypothetical protein
MARKKAKIKIDFTSLIEFKDLFDGDGTIRMNPFKVKGKTYRIVGTENIGDVYFHTILCEETREFTSSDSRNIKARVMSKKTHTPVLPIIKVESLTVEEAKKNDPRQRNIFDEVPDVKKK